MIVRDVKFKDLDAVYNLLNQLKFVFTHQVDKLKLGMSSMVKDW